jgi:outer membrane protein assembly factor BamB
MKAMAANVLCGMAAGTAIPDIVCACPAVVPVLVGPLQVLLTLLPGILVAVFGGLLGLFRPSGFKNAVKLLWRQKVAVTCIIAVAAGVFLGVRQLWPGGGSGLVTGAQEGNDWPTARFDLSRHGVVPGTQSPTRPTLVWSALQGHGFFASPAVVGNRVYIASANIGGFQKTGSIYCLDADTGAVVWSSAPSGYRATFSSPVVSGRYLVCGEGLHDTRDARIVCLDIHDGGKVLWTFRTSNHVECTPVIADGRVYVGAGDDGYYCLDLEPGLNGEPTVHWHKPGADYPDAETSLAVHDGKVYAGLGNTGKALVVLDAATGAELKRVPMPYPVFSPPSIADGKLYLGMGNGDYVASGEGGEVRCLDLATHETLWSFALPRTVLGAVAVAGDKLYFGCNDHHVYCLSRDGKLLRKPFNSHAPIKTSPAVTDEHVFVVNDAGNLFALDRHTLEPVFPDYRLATGGLFISSPAVARGHVYVGTQTGGILCVGKPASTKRVPYWPAPNGGAGVAGNADGSPLPKVGAVAWRFDEPVAAAPAVWDNTLYVPVAGPKRRGLLGLPLADADKAAPAPAWFFDAEQEPHGAPVIVGNLIAFAAGRHGSAERRLHFVDRHTGQHFGSHPIEPSSGAVLSATPHQFLVQDRVDNLTSFDAEGAKEWSVPLGRLIHAPASSATMILAAVVGPDAVVALDRATGAELWRVPLPGAPLATPLLGKASFLLAALRGIEKRSLVNGERDETWSAEGGLPSGEIVVAGEQLAFVNQQGEVVVLERSTGRATLTLPGAAVGTTPLASRGMALFAAPGRLMSFLLSDDFPLAEPWVEWPEAAKDAVASGHVLSGGRLYAALGESGLVCVGSAP